MFSQLPVSSWCCASISASYTRGSGFKYHLLQFFFLYRISSGKNSNTSALRQMDVLTGSHYPEVFSGDTAGQ